MPKFNLGLKRYLSLKGMLYAVTFLILLMSFVGHVDSLFYCKTSHPMVVEPVGMENNVEYRQRIPYQEGDITAFELNFGTYRRSNKGILKVALLCDSRELQSWKIDTVNLSDNAYQKFKFTNPIRMNGVNSYYIVLKNQFDGQNNIIFYISNDVNDINYIEFDNKVIANKSLAVSYVKTFSDQISECELYKKFFAIFLLALVLVISLFVNPKNIKVRSYLLLLVFGILCIRTLDYNLFQHLAKTANIREWQKSESVDTIYPYHVKQYSVNYSRPFDTLKIYMGGNNRESIHIKFTSTDGTIFIDQNVNPKDIIKDANSGKNFISINQQKKFQPGTYSVEIYNNGKNEIDVSTLENGDLNFGISVNTFLAAKIMIVIIAILLVYFAIMFVLIACGSDFPVEKWFLLTVIPIATIYLILFNPLSQNDTDTHMSATYRLSNKLLGYSELEEWKGRLEDAEFMRHFGIDMSPSLRTYSEINYYSHLKCENSDIVELPNPQPRMNFYSFFNYLPQIIGITLGRLLNLGTILSIYLGRIFILAVYIAMIYRNIKKIPVGKWIIATVALLPMSLMMSSALSYDAMVIISSLSFITCVLQLLKEQTICLYLESLLWAFVAGAVKGGGYLVMLLPLAFLLFSHSHTKRSLCQILGLATVGLFSVLLFDKILPASLGFQFGLIGGGAMAAAYAIHEPLQYLDMAMATYLTDLDSLSINVGGMRLAWGTEQTIPAVIIVLFMIVGGIQSVFEKDHIKLRKVDRWIFISIAVIGVLSIPAMLLSNTPVGFSRAWGVQGRYFLPLLPILYYVLTKFSLYTPNKSNQGQIVRTGAVCLSVLVCFEVYYIMSLYLTR